MSYNCIFYSISLIIGISLVIYSIKQLLHFRKMIKTNAIVLEKHSIMWKDTYVTRVEFIVNGVVRECDLNFYSFFLKKGKKIKIYYNPDKYWEINCIQGNIFILILGILFFIGSLYLFFAM